VAFPAFVVMTERLMSITEGQSTNEEDKFSFYHIDNIILEDDRHPSLNPLNTKLTSSGV